MNRECNANDIWACTIILMLASAFGGCVVGHELGKERYRRIGFEEGLLYEPREAALKEGV